MHHPDFAEAAAEKLSADDFVSALHRRIYSEIADCAAEGRDFDISALGQQLDPAQMGYLTNLMNGEKCNHNALVLLNDSIAVMKRERMNAENRDSKNSSVEDWADTLKKIAENKK